MYTLAKPCAVAASSHPFREAAGAQRLTAKDGPEVRRALAERPLQAFGLLGMIDVNGLVSPHNRGDFYAYRGPENELEGVALIGYNTVIDARTEEALEAFAGLAKAVVNPFLILAQEQQIDRFIEYYAGAMHACTAVERYWLFRHGDTTDRDHPLPDVRLATIDDLERVAWANNQCGIEETGVDGLALDAEGFTARCARRIKGGRTWVWIDRGKLILKLEVITAAREVTYLESLWVHPEERCKGYASRFLSQVSGHLLKTSATICLLAEEHNTAAHLVYAKAGYRAVDAFQTIFCNQTMKA